MTSSRSIINQIMTSLIAGFLMCLVGLVFSWPSYTTNMFISNNTVLSRPMTVTEASLLGSLSSGGAILTIPLVGYLIDKIGRKQTMILAGIPFVTTWCILAFTSSVEMVLFAMFVSGIACSAQMASPLYIGEIAQDSIRGALTSVAISEFLIGVLISYAMGGYMTYEQVVYAQLSLSVLYIVFIYFVKESPVYFCQIGNDKAAKDSLSHYRGFPINSKEMETELVHLKLLVNPEKVIDLSETETLNPKAYTVSSAKKAGKCQSFKFLCKSSSSQKALFLCLFMLMTTISMGMADLQVNADTIFQKLMPSYDKNTVTSFSIGLAAIMLVGGLISTMVSDYFGRKPLMVFSSLASSLLTLLIGLQEQFSYGPEWVSALLIYAYSLAYNMGAGTVPYVLMAEVFLPEIKGLCSTLCLEWAWLVNFIVLYAFNPLKEATGVEGVFYIFSGISLVCGLYSLFIMPETKGLPTDAIQLLFVSKKKNELRT